MDNEWIIMKVKYKYVKYSNINMSEKNYSLM